MSAAKFRHKGSKICRVGVHFKFELLQKKILEVLVVLQICLCLVVNGSVPRMLNCVVIQDNIQARSVVMLIRSLWMNGYLCRTFVSDICLFYEAELLELSWENRIATC